MQPCSTARNFVHALLAGLILLTFSTRAETVYVVVASNAAPRVTFGAERVVESLKVAGFAASRVHQVNRGIAQRVIVVGNMHDAAVSNLITSRSFEVNELPAKEGFVLVSSSNGWILVGGGDDSGALYGCLELTQQIQRKKSWPKHLSLRDKPALTLRGTCVGMQKTYILPGRKVYEYPYTPELFPWFYDKDALDANISTPSSPTA
jgi:hypothetical protein